MNKARSAKANLTRQVPEKQKPLTYNDFITLFFVAAALLIDFLPYFKSFEIIAPQFLYLTLLNIAVGLYIYFDPALHQTGALLIFKKSFVFRIYLAFLILSGISIFTAKNTSLGIISMAEMLVVFAMVVNFSMLFYGRMHLIYNVCFLVGISALFQAGKALHNFKVLSESASVSAALASDFLKGNTGNINVLSVSLLFKVPFLYLGIVNYKKGKRWFLVLALLLATTIIFLINARASLISLILITLCFIACHLKNRSHQRHALLRLGYLILPIVVSFFAVNIIFSKAKLEGRFTSTTDRLTNVNVEDGSINRRLLFYKISLKMAQDNPITGIGLGNFRVESIPYDLSTNASIPLHAHNDFLEVTAETGFLNGFLYLSIFVALVFINLKRLVKRGDIPIKNVALLTLLLLIIYGIDATFNFPMYRPTMQLCFCFITAFTFVNVESTSNGSTVNKKLLMFVIVLALLPLYFTYHAYKTSNLEYLIQTDNINFEQSGVLNGDDVVTTNPKFPNVFQSAESFVEYAGIYYFRAKKYDQAIKLLDSTNTILSLFWKARFLQIFNSGRNWSF